MKQGIYGKQSYMFVASFYRILCEKLHLETEKVQHASRMQSSIISDWPIPGVTDACIFQFDYNSSNNTYLYIRVCFIMFIFIDMCVSYERCVQET